MGAWNVLQWGLFVTETDRFFADDEGLQPYAADEIPVEHEVQTAPYDSPVRALVQDIIDKRLIVRPKYQRQSVWNVILKSRLIESIILNIPIPVLFFKADVDGTHVVVDGQQRLRAIEEFYSGQYRLKGLQALPGLNNKRWVDLDMRLARRIENRTLRCMVISSKADPNIEFELFERINTGSVPLNDQEIRNCIFRGPFNDALNDCVTSDVWLDFIGKKEPDVRLRHHELALRFLAFRDDFASYRPPLKKALNDHMRRNRHLDGVGAEDMVNSFVSAVANVTSIFGRQSFKRVRLAVNNNGMQMERWDSAINRAVFDTQMICLSGLGTGELLARRQAIIDGFRELCLDDQTFQDSVSRATADRSRFLYRLERFADLLQRSGFQSQRLDEIGQLRRVG